MSDEFELIVEDPSAELVAEDGATELVSTTDDFEVLVAETNNEVVIEENSVEIIEVGIQGPAGPPSEEEMQYAKRTDIASDSLIYRAEAEPGALESDAVWRIYRLTLGADGDVTTEWADGNALFDNIWANRAALQYA